MNRAIERIDAYLALAEKATEGPWTNHFREHVIVKQDRPWQGLNRDDVEFVCASRTEGVWAAEQLNRALELLQQYRNAEASDLECDEFFEELNDAEA